jgi:uncharacterized membrane protein YeaQ/YmgE (transglycosylase-associated protein family)
MINIGLWMVFGVLAGFVVSRLSKRLAPDHLIVNSVAGVLGAMIAGFVFLIFDVTPLEAISVWSIIVALGGALGGIWLAQMLVRGLI